MIPNPMHNHQRISRSIVAELLHKFVENAIKIFYTVVRLRQQVLDQSHPLIDR